MPKNKVQLLLDSGAFSAWNKGEPDLPLKDYIAFIKQHEKLLFAYVSMDKIPGQFGKRRTTDDVERSAKQSYKNHQIMKEAGLSPIPVYHMDEDYRWLERYLKDGETYIGVSLSKDMNARAKHDYCRKIFSMVSDSKGKPLVRIHGFGITKPSLLLQFPWATVDSTTWSITSAFGKIPIPRQHPLTGLPDYSKPAVGIAVSGVPNKANNASQFEGEAFFVGTGLREGYIRWWMNEVVKVSAAELRYTLLARQRAGLTYYVGLMRNIPLIKPPAYNKGFFREDVHRLVPKPVKVDKLKIMFATLIKQNDWSDLMNDVGAMTRLLSFYELRNVKPELIEEFVRTGTNKRERKRRTIKKWRGEVAKNVHIMNAIRYAKRETKEYAD